MNTTFSRIFRVLMALNALVAAFITGGLIVGGDYIGAFIAFCACPISLLIWWLVDEADRMGYTN
jgi:hypothetical protein